MFLSYRCLPPAFILLLIILIFSGTAANAQGAANAHSPVQFKKQVVSAAFVAEGVAVGDINRDGALDILAGNYWYEAPLWKRHLIHADTTHPVPGYSTSFLNFCMDVNNDGWPDLIRFDEPGGICVWYENPGAENKLWQGRTILQKAGIETPLCVDIDGDGKTDLLCNDAAAKQVIWLKAPAIKGDTAWQRYVISHDSLRATDRYTHGLGWGDVNGDGRKDVLIKSGWWQGPANVKDSDWTFHAADFGEDCANMYTLDVDGDGDQDVISSSAHKYGIWWHEQVKDEQGNTTWITHTISTLFSQSHALVMADINGDGHPTLLLASATLPTRMAMTPGLTSRRCYTGLSLCRANSRN